MSATAINVISPAAIAAATTRKAAGIMLVAEDGSVCLLRRGNQGDFAGHWGIPGGHIEEGEDAETAARRETLEETGLDFKGELRCLYDDGVFTTFSAQVPKFDVKICDESTGHVWAKPADAPLPIHPGLEIPFKVAAASSELDVARLIADGHLSSPQPYANMHLLALRITGTGLAYRSSIGEHVWRDASIFLNQDFVARCNGLTVIMDHPPKSILDSKEFKKRNIGSILYPYVKGDEVWGIAKIYDDDALAEICEGEISTSPAVVFDENAGNTILTTESGERLLIEGKPFLLDHIAVVTKDRGSRGVWDKGGDPSGVELNNPEIATMGDETKVKADSATAVETVETKIDKLFAVATGTLQHVKDLTGRVDAMEKNMPAKTLEPVADKRKDEADPDKKKADEDESKKKADADEADKKAKADADEKAKADKARKDAEGSNNGVMGADGKIRPDAEKEEKDRMDAAAKCDSDSAAYADVQAKFDSVLSAFGKSASRPMQGETLMAYRQRLLKGIQSHSDTYKGVNLRAIGDEAAFGIAETHIIKDALAAAKNPSAFGDQLVETRTRDRGGRMVSTFHGNIGAWLDQFKLPPMRVTEFNTRPRDQRRA